MAQFNLNVNDPEAQAPEFTPVPEGDYIVTLEKTEEKVAKTGKKFLEFSFRILEGQYSGRRVWERFYIYEPEKRGGIVYAKRMTRLMLEAQGLTEIRDTAELEGRNFLVTVKVDKNGDWERNVITNYNPVPKVEVKTADMKSAPW